MNMKKKMVVLLAAVLVMGSMSFAGNTATKSTTSSNGSTSQSSYGDMDWGSDDDNMDWGSDDDNMDWGSDDDNMDWGSDDDNMDWNDEDEAAFEKEIADALSKEDYAKYTALTAQLEKVDYEKNAAEAEALFVEMDKILDKYEDKFRLGDDSENWDSEDLGEDFGDDADFEKELKGIFSKADYAKYTALMAKLDKVDYEKNEAEANALFDEIDKIFDKYEDKFDMGDDMDDFDNQNMQ